MHFTLRPLKTRNRQLLCRLLCSLTDRIPLINDESTRQLIYPAQQGETHRIASLALDLCQY